MNITDISSAKRLKFNLTYDDRNAKFCDGAMIRLDATQQESTFMVTQYGEKPLDSKPVLCTANRPTASYIHELQHAEQCQAYRCLFSIDGCQDNTIEVQAYTFQSITEYKTPIKIVIGDELASRVPCEKLLAQYVWKQLECPALFCMNYRSAKRRSEAVRFIDGRRSLIVEKNGGTLFSNKTTYLKKKYDVPIDIFVAPEIHFVRSADYQGDSSGFIDDIQAISNPSSYFARWEAYNALSKKLSKSESDQFGKMPYRLISKPSGFSRGIKTEFETDEVIDDEYIGRGLGVAISDSSEKKGPERIVDVGTIASISGRQVTTVLEYDEDMDPLPQTGFLVLNTRGTEAILKRRNAARDRMISNRSPIQGLVGLIESGRSAYGILDSWGTQKAVTNRLKRNFPKTSTLNAEQVKAIDLAINTPDIAIIQGPPGTGKTTVIKAICERFREAFEQREQQAKVADPTHMLQSTSILISSFQNEAVDNAISDPLPGDIPAFRKTSKRASDARREQYQRSLEKWYGSLRETISASITNSTVNTFARTRDELEDAFLSYKNAGEPIEMAADLIRRYLGFVEIPYPKDLVDVANAIVASKTPDDYEDQEDPIVAKIESQRLSPEAFDDDGERNARRLAAYIRINDDLDIPEHVLSAIEEVVDDRSDKTFEGYVSAVELLRKQFCSRGPKIDYSDKEVIDACILSLSNAFSNHYTSTLTSLEDKKSIVLYDFLERLEQDYEAIVEKYSMTTAATCQTSMDLYGNTDRIYDLVIVDEAARANPLDLFIPMSMGRRVILVGDQKQLPHMLEPDIVNMLTADPDFSAVDDIEVSLFERLYDMFSKGTKPKAVQLTKQYRMHPDICRFVSESFYEGALETASEITPQLRSCPKSINEGKPLAFIDIPISRGAETSGVSKSRRCEAEAICKSVKHIMHEDRNSTVGVITFYSAQAKLITTQLSNVLDDEERDRVETGTVDSFQGKEFDYVLLSCVRSNAPRDGSSPVVGFLEKPNRLCVAFSRAIRQLAVYGDARTLCQIASFSRLHEICSEGGGYLATY